MLKLLPCPLLISRVPRASLKPAAVPGAHGPYPFDPSAYYAFVAAAMRLEEDGANSGAPAPAAPITPPSLLSVPSPVLSARLAIDLWSASDLDVLYATRALLQPSPVEGM